jgi:hypothetical protein
MDVFQLTHKVRGRNGGDEPVPVDVVERGGRSWSIAEACRLTIAGKAAFMYRGELLTDLAILPIAAQSLKDRP